MTDVVLVSFITGRPGDGSEGGVGWTFIAQAARWAIGGRRRVHVVLDERDRQKVDDELTRSGLRAGVATLVGVPLPPAVLARAGMARTRQTYFAWRPAARAAVEDLRRRHPVGLVHQVTFATATLPSVLPVALGVHTVWGPLAVPAAPVAHMDGNVPTRERAGVAVARLAARWNARGVGLVIANNEPTLRQLGGLSSTLEPNIMLQPLTRPSVYDDELLVCSGMLIDRKRPWLAVLAMNDPRLRGLRLDLLGDGPLRPALESLIRQERLESRVSIRGRLSRDEALRTVGSARALVHPAVREGSPWSVGEAAALGVPGVAIAGSGADTVVALSDNGGAVVGADRVSDGVVEVLARPRPEPTSRWDAVRVPGLLDAWWDVP